MVSISEIDENLFFEPWIGPNYEAGLIKSKKTLIVGESHYIWDPINKPLLDRSFTRTTIEDEIAHNCHRSWNNLIPAMMGKDYLKNSDRAQFFNSVVFYNFVQRQLGSRSGKDRPTRTDWSNGLPIFHKILEFFQPEFVIIFGLEVWNNTADMTYEEELLEGLQLQQKVRHYPLKGHNAVAYGVRHPASYFSQSIWHPNIKRVVEIL